MKHFITFGAGGQNYKDACSRLTRQASQMNIFDKITAFSDNDLKGDNEFWPKHGNFLENNKRGYGYWIWKPYIIKKTMDSMKDGDILMYLDSGCELDYRKRDKMIEMFSVVQKDLIIGTIVHGLSDADNIEAKWTKADLFEEMKITDETIKNSKQRQAGIDMFFVCKETRELVNEWYSIACKYNLIDNSPSIKPNIKGFMEHRHDQSIFSLLTKKYNIFSNTRLNNAIHQARNFSKDTLIKY